MKTRIATIILAVSLCTALLSGCGGSTTASNYEPAVPATPDTSSTLPAETGDQEYATQEPQTDPYEEIRQKIQDFVNESNLRTDSYVDAMIESGADYNQIIDYIQSINAREYKFTNYEPYSNGYAWVSYTDDTNNEHYAVIDKQGKIIYNTQKYPWFSADGFGSDGYAYYGYKTQKYGEEPTYVIIDSDGNECYTAPNTDNEYIKISGHGESVFVATRNVTSFSENTTDIITINADGQVVSAKQGEKLLPQLYYYGEGIFTNRYTGWNDMYLYNLNTSHYFEIPSSCHFETPFENGFALFWCMIDGHTNTYSVSPEIFDSKDIFEQWNNGLLADNNFLKKPELNIPETVSVVGYGEPANGYYPVILRGADNNDYYTTVSLDGEQQFDPIKIKSAPKYIMGSSVDWSEAFCAKGAYAYSDNGIITVISPKGNVSTYGGSKIERFDGDYVYTDVSIIDLETGTVLNTIKEYTGNAGSINTNETATEETQKNYQTISSFSIDGKWKNVGTYTFGQVQDGAIVSFDGTYCNVYSPRDTYAFYKDGDDYRLDTTSLLGDTTSFTVKIVDKDNIDVYYGPNYLELTTIAQTAYTAVTSDLYYSGGYLGTLSIPRLGVNVKVYEGTDSAQLAKGAGHFIGTSIDLGNVCIAGHNRGVNCYFGNIHTLNSGDRITLATKLGTRTYSVTSVKKISETDNTDTAATTENCITLFTCVRDQSTYRWCVRATEIM